ncbi:alpha-1,2-fucosyltransferase [Amylibacter sp.]|nr:alpha-1,2-fucosyltransferase [Amylibacter sp.]MDC1488673.1 alpha-1,2-fucosyltransferase [bacterium]MDC1531965.1 alpha-1,2-fucosyltransferase [Amylibacter sp.]
MIYSRIRGGLGNQLFQYSVARSLADQLGVDLGLDIREYNNLSNFEMGLSNFNIRAIFNPDGLIRHKQDGKILFALENLIGMHKHVYYEPFLSFDKNVLTKQDGTFLKGHWQSENYFIDKNKIMEDLQIVKQPTEKNIQLKSKIEECNSISLHIRRGDYVSNSAHGLCDLTYYYKAVQFFIDKYGSNFEIFAFSDDPNWVKNNLELPVKINFISNNSSKNNYEDLRLMSYCEHNIIANSTFSWWGAWLNKNPKKYIIAPKKWFANNKIENNDITPQNWLRI